MGTRFSFRCGRVGQARQFARNLGLGELSLKGVHSDIRSIIWSDEICGSSLRNTYETYFSDRPNFQSPQQDDPYVGWNEEDCYWTYKLWELWGNPRKNRKLIDGIIRERDSTLMSNVAKMGEKLYDNDFYTLWRIKPQPMP